MDPIGAAASIIGLIEGTYRLVDFLSDLKDGGKERMKLLAEVSYMACTLDSLKEKLDQNCLQQGLLTLVKAGGPLDQCRSIVATLTKELTLKAGVGGRVAQRLSWSFKKEDVHMAVEKLHRIQVTVAQQITIAMTEQIQSDSAIARELLHDQHEQRIRNWLSPLNFVAQQSAIYENHCSGTGARFLQSAQFDAWRKSSKSIMWCRGPPGAGKTYLASLIVHELQQGSRAELDIVLVVYCRYDDPNCQSIANIVGDLLKQCLRGRRAPDGLVQLFRTHSSTDTRPTYEALLPFLYEQLESYRKCYIVVDALDELADPGDRDLLVAALRPLSATGGTGGFASQRFRRNSINRSIKVATSLIVMSRDLEDIKAAVEPINDCICSVGTTLGQCNRCEERAPGFLSGSEHLYNYKDCALPHDTTSAEPNVCQRCYDAGIGCPEDGHPSMRGRVNSFVYDVSADQEEMRRYIEWRIENDTSLRILVKKKDGLQNHVLDAVLQGAGSMLVHPGVCSFANFV
jgi:AAA domain